MRYWIAAGVGLLLSTSHGPVWAQTAADKAAADTLFTEGKRLIAAGEIEPACAKFEASLARLAQLGAQLALASCYEKLGKTASAWGEFRAAASTAIKAHDDQRQRFAEDHAAALEPNLSRLVIKVEPGYRIDGLELKRDGVVITAAELDSPVPVDPGDHMVEAAAPGWVAWSIKVPVTLPGAVDVVVPALGKAPVKVEEPRPAPEPVVAVAAAPAAVASPRHRSYLAYGVAGGGVVALGASVLFGAMASTRWSAAQSYCHDRMCSQPGYDLATRARTMGTLGTGAFIVGTAAAATGVALLLISSPDDTAILSTRRSAALRLRPSVGADQVALAMEGVF
jgi:hypothetical protein